MDITYYVALPFVMADDGLAPGEAVECLSANAAVMRAEALSRKPRLRWRGRLLADRRPVQRRLRRRQGHPEVRRGAGRSEHALTGSGFGSLVAWTGCICWIEQVQRRFDLGGSAWISSRSFGPGSLSSRSMSACFRASSFATVDISFPACGRLNWEAGAPAT